LLTEEPIGRIVIESVFTISAEALVADAAGFHCIRRAHHAY
jgi:hypothetical protein